MVKEISMSKKLKIVIIVVIILIVGIGGASLLGNKTPVPVKSSSPLTSSSGSAPAGTTSQNSASSDEFSNLLSSVKRITIDTSIFDNPAYKMLRDFPVSLGSDIVGRVNPFAPIGTDSASSAPTQDVYVDTLQSGKVTSTTAEFGAQLSLSDTVPTSVVFEYGTSDIFGNTTTPVVVTKSGTTLVTVTKLLPETTYYVRAVTVRGSSTTTGNTTTFTTTKK